MGSPATTSTTSTEPPLRLPTGSSIPHILLLAAQILLLASPPFKGRRFISTYLILSLLVVSQLDPYFSTDVSVAQPASIGWAFAASTLEKLALSGPSGPEGAFWRVNSPQGEALSYPAFSLSKLRWALVLITNMRGVRWNFQVKNVPPLPNQRRRAFIVSQTVTFIYYVLMADLFGSLSAHWLYGTINERIGHTDSTFFTLRHTDWRWRFAKSLVFGATPYYMLSAQYTFAGIIAVLAGLSQPEVQ
jgi:hypothetical protein